MGTRSRVHVSKLTRLIIAFKIFYKYCIWLPLWLLKSKYRVAIMKYKADKRTELKVEETKRFIKENPHIAWKGSWLRVYNPRKNPTSDHVHGEKDENGKSVIHRPLS